MKKLPLLCKMGIHIWSGPKGLKPGSVMGSRRCIRCGIGQ